MTGNNRADFIVLGAGPAGYAAAFRAADLGFDVVLVDPHATLGGVCLNEGCIPSKTLLHVAEIIRDASAISVSGIKFGAPKIDIDRLRQYKEDIITNLTGGLAQLAKKRKIRIVQGKANFTGQNSLNVSHKTKITNWHFERAVIAVGSAPIALPNWPDDPRIMDSSAALKLKNIPKKLAIVGGGIIGVEMATIYAALGSKVTIIELAPTIIQGADPQAAKMLHEALEQNGCVIHTSTKVDSVNAHKSTITINCFGIKNLKITADSVIQAVGRAACGQLVSPHAAGIIINENGVIPIDSQCRTNQPHIFAIGDVTGDPMLAHRGSYQGKIAAESAANLKAAFDTDLIPSVCYTNPEIAWVGLTEQLAKNSNTSYKTTIFPWAASGRNLASGGTKGMTKLTYCPHSHRLLGGTIVGRHAGELLAEIVLAIESGLRLEDLALTIHAHPTLSETTAFAAELALGTCTDL